MNAKKAASKSAPASPPSESEVKRSPATSADAVVGEIRISHPDRVIFPDSDITKQKLAEYYHAVADAILPHLKNRPLSMLRCPDGIGKTCFFQRHVARGQSPYLHEAAVTVHGRNESYLSITDVHGLITLVQWGAIEMHPWGCLADKPDQPDRMIFDLDPDPTVPWENVVEAAEEIHQRMKEFGLVCFIKTTGGKGLHVVVPLTRSLGWQPVKAFSRAIAESMQSDNPTLYIAKASKTARAGKIFVDYLRNDLTATSVAAYSAQARPGAHVSWPLAWEELKPSLQPQNFTVQTVPSLLRARKTDPWAEFFSVRQKIAARVLRALKVDV